MLRTSTFTYRKGADDSSNATPFRLNCNSTAARSSASLNPIPVAFRFRVSIAALTGPTPRRESRS